jgi:hypothetical protein
MTTDEDFRFSEKNFSDIEKALRSPGKVLSRSEEALHRQLSQDCREDLQTLCGGMPREYRRWNSAPDYQAVRDATADDEKKLAAALAVVQKMQNFTGPPSARAAVNGIRLQYSILKTPSVNRLRTVDQDRLRRVDHP